MPFKVIWSSKKLILTLTKRELAARFKGSFLGGGWLIIQPLFMLLVYSFVFGLVFKAKWGGGHGGDYYSLALFCGLALHGAFAEVLSRSPTVISSHVSFVKRVMFPLEILPVVTVAMAMWQVLISTLLLTIGIILFGPGIGEWTLGFFLAMPPLVLWLLGLSWLLSALGVYLKDIGHFMGIVVSVLLFLSPIFYSIEMIPEALKVVVYVNPLTYIIEIFRNTLLFNEPPEISYLFLSYGVSGIFCVLGGVFFTRVRSGFSDVL